MSLASVVGMRANLRTAAFRLVFVGLCTLLLAGCGVKEERSLNIPQGSATLTLREFARQADVEILFDLQIVRGVETNAVNGKYEPGSALRMMLEDTRLGVDFEKESGAYAVYRKEF